MIESSPQTLAEVASQQLSEQARRLLSRLAGVVSGTLPLERREV